MLKDKRCGWQKQQIRSGMKEHAIFCVLFCSVFCQKIFLVFLFCSVLWKHRKTLFGFLYFSINSILSSIFKSLKLDLSSAVEQLFFSKQMYVHGNMIYCIYNCHKLWFIIYESWFMTQTMLKPYSDCWIKLFGWYFDIKVIFWLELIHQETFIRREMHLELTKSESESETLESYKYRGGDV